MGLHWRFVLEPLPEASNEKAAGFAAALLSDEFIRLSHHVTAASLYACTRTQRAIRFATGAIWAAMMLAVIILAVIILARISMKIILRKVGSVKHALSVTLRRGRMQ